MKLIVVVAVLIALCSGNSIPRDNSHYVEGESRYIWMPDGEGVPHLVDLHEQVEEEFLTTRNGANNQYWLYTRENPYVAQIITHGNANSVFNSNYLGARPLKVIVHGWNGNGNNEVNSLATGAFLSVQDCNVIVVDWRTVASANYVSAVSGVPGVGQFLGNFLIWLTDVAGGGWNVHLVGFSLGAHVVGVAGRTANGRPWRVTGLDPAGPLWTINSNALNAQSGQYVEAIHTNGGQLGIFNRVADADFYPNGGRSQPGCFESNCSHGRAVWFFASSVYYNSLVGRECASLAEASAIQCSGSVLNMGNAIVNKSGRGIFGLTTLRSWPFF